MASNLFIAVMEVRLGSQRELSSRERECKDQRSTVKNNSYATAGSIVSYATAGSIVSYATAGSIVSYATAGSSYTDKQFTLSAHSHSVLSYYKMIS